MSPDLAFLQKRQKHICDNVYLYHHHCATMKLIGYIVTQFNIKPKTPGSLAIDNKQDSLILSKNMICPSAISPTHYSQVSQVSSHSHTCNPYDGSAEFTALSLSLVG